MSGKTVTWIVAVIVLLIVVWQLWSLIQFLADLFEAST